MASVNDIKITGIMPEETTRHLQLLKLIFQAAQQARLIAAEHQAVVNAYKELEQLFLKSDE